MINGELVVDNFAGGGGASAGMEAAGAKVDIAINHDPEAIAIHQTNHPDTIHYCESVWDVEPINATQGRPVGVAWFSPDCKHFSKAKGGKPVDKNIRGLAWVVIRWAAKVRPRIIMLENVEEFQDWGPLDKNNKPEKALKGTTFKKWAEQLRILGYHIEYKTLRACDYGAPTSRRRLFLIARCDNQPIVWPEATHGDGLLPFRTAGDIIDFSLPCPSIFTRRRPLAENTLKRIARGIQKFVVDSPKPFIVRIGQTGWAGDGFQYDIDSPLTTVTSKAEHCLVTTHLMKLRNNCIGQAADEPLHTVTAGGNHFAEVRAFLIKYYGANVGQSLHSPIHTITSRDRFGLVLVKREQYQIVDIGMRMMQPRELFNAQSFEPDYIIDRTHDGEPITKKAQVRMCGNSVPPVLAKALVKANLGNNLSRKVA